MATKHNLLVWQHDATCFAFTGSVGRFKFPKALSNESRFRVEAKKLKESEFKVSK